MRGANKREIKSDSPVNQHTGTKEEQSILLIHPSVLSKSPLLLQPVFSYISSVCLLIGGQDGGRANTRGAGREHARPTQANCD